MIRAAALTAVLLLGATCEGPDVEEPRRFRVSFVDSGANTQTPWRSHDLPNLHEWDGTSDLHYLQLTAPALVSALVTPAGGSGPVPGGTTVFLDAPGQAADISRRVESNNVFGSLLVPGQYDVFVAPGRLLTGQAAARFPRVTLSAITPDWVWSLPDPVVVEGDVEVLGAGRAGQYIVPYPDDFGGLPLGSFALSREADEGVEGSFSISVPEGDYRVVVAPPTRRQPSGIVQPDPVAPVHVTTRWPIRPAGVRELIKAPALPIVPVEGRVVLNDQGVPTVARIRVEGRVAPQVLGGETYDGGRWIAEMPTDGDGLFRVDVPRGTYTVTATPSYDQRGLDVGRAEFVATGGEVVDVEIQLPQAPLGQVLVLDEGGRPVPDATLYIRKTEPPRYAYGVSTRGSDDRNAGFWFDTLMRGVYKIEVVPPVDPDTGLKRWARERGELDLTDGDASATVRLRPSALMDGSVFSVAGQPVGDVMVVLRDPDTGHVLDEALTNRSTQVGFFRGILPETSDDSIDEDDDE